LCRHNGKKLSQVLKGSKNDASPVGLRVADVIVCYLRLYNDRYSERAFEERFRYQQTFADAHGWRKVNDKACLPLYVKEWIVEHPGWKCRRTCQNES